MSCINLFLVVYITFMCGYIRIHQGRKTIEILLGIWRKVRLLLCLPVQYGLLYVHIIVHLPYCFYLYYSYYVSSVLVTGSKKKDLCYIISSCRLFGVLSKSKADKTGKKSIPEMNCLYGNSHHLVLETCNPIFHMHLLQTWYRAKLLQAALLLSSALTLLICL